ncbi:MAG TPA: RNA polymerase sigma-70 factor [Chitinophaga sp.]|uniref:RNA polymerase sigma factor n=1 Tax=Chitinophaga sp. TaxID=1869181 RepID=UPI002BE1F614|nr:RNA polymerase sigma-70 factor [Chitinophaga sp.]HVI46660.1 RNA polymerase sigma-70 factor [Chitinophaga sp.]
MKYQYLTDTELLQLVARDDAAAYEILYNRYWEPLFLFAYKRLKFTSPAKDVVQDVFISLWKRRTTLQVTASLRTYLFTAVRYEVLRNIAQLEQGPVCDDQALLHVPAEAAAADLLYEKELRYVLTDAIDKLPVKMKEIYVLSRQHHKSISEIASELALSEQTVKNQLSKALARLRMHLKEASLIPVLAPGIIFFLNN